MAQSDRIADGFAAVGLDVKGLLERIAVLEGNATAPYDPVYVIWGQSNAQGYSPIEGLPSELSGQRPNAWLWKDASGWVKLQAKTASSHPLGGNDFGLEMQFSESAYAYHKKPVYFVKHTYGGTGLAVAGQGNGKTWDPAVRGDLYDAAFDNLNRALAALVNQGKNPKVVAFIWGQGEEDSRVNNGAAYQTKQVQLFNAVRNAVNNPQLPIVDMLIRSESPTYPNYGDTNAAKRSVAAGMSNVTTLETDALPDRGDDVHYNGPGSLAFGRRAFELALRLTYPYPAQLPEMLFDLDPSQQRGWIVQDGIHVLRQLTDLSGNGRHFVQDTVANRPQLVEGGYRSFGVARTPGSRWLFGPAWPLASGEAYTMALVIGNFLNSTSSANRALLGGSASSDFNLSWAQNGNNKLRLYHTGALMLESSVATPSSGMQLLVISYTPGDSIMRSDGATVATSAATNTNQPPTAMQLFGSASLRNAQVDVMRYTAFKGRATLPQIERIEGYLAWRYGLSLPAQHAYAAGPPM